MGCGRSKPETKVTPAAGPAPAPAPGPAPAETATISTTGATTLSLNLTGQGVVLMNTSLVDLGFSTSHPIGNTLPSGTPVVNYLYIRLGVTDIQSPATGPGITSKPVVTIYKNEENSASTPVFTLLYENLVVNSFTENNSFEQTYKVRLPSNIFNKISSIKVKIKWQRPSGGPTSVPIEITEKIQDFDLSNIYNFINDSDTSQILTIANDLEPFTNYLSIEGYMDDSPLLGKSYARF